METILGLASAFGTAVCKSATDIGTKIASRNAEERTILAVQWSTSALLLSIACVIWYPALMTDPVSVYGDITGPNFWWVLVVNGALNAIAFYFYVRAFRYADASLVAPLMLVTPLLLLVTSPIMLGEKIPLIGVIGVVSTIVGGHYLGRSIGGSSISSSMRALVRNKGVQSMLVTAVIWSITANLDKIGVQSATPLFWSANICTVIALYSILFWLLMPKKKGGFSWQIPISGAFNAVGVLLHVYALTFLFVPYVIAIKRLSAPLTVLLSGSLLGEKTKDRLLGSVIMLLGTVLIALGS